MRVLFFIKPYIIDPLGIAYLSSVLKFAGHEVALEHNDNCVAKANLWKPDVVAFSVTTGQHAEYIKNALEIKSVFPGIKTVFGGPHPTYFPVRPDGVDYIIRGEAENSFLSFIENMDSTNIIEPFPLIQNIDEIPKPDRSLIYRFKENRSNPIKNVMTSRGCPFNCPYCYNAVYKKIYADQNIIRHHSVDRVISECVDLKENHKAKFIFFADDEFAKSKNRLKDISREYIKKVGLPYHAQIRIDLLTAEKAELLKKSGCRSVTFAIESGDEKYRKNVLKRKITNEQIINGSKLLHKYGILFRTENMLGFPGEDIESAIATLDLNIRCHPGLAWASLYQPYPGTVLGDKCIREGLFHGSVDDLKPSFFEDTVLPLKKKSQFINLQRIFGIVANYPVLRKGLRPLLTMPTNSLYEWIYKFWKTNRYDRKLYTY